MATNIFRRLRLMDTSGNIAITTMTIPSASSFFASFGTIIAISPIIVWAHDGFFSICKIRGKSMEPTLYCGDIVVVRKSDGFWQRWTRPRPLIKDEEEDEEEKKGTKGKKQPNKNDNNEWAIERGKILAFERDYCNSNGSIGLFRKPPTPINGDIVVYKNPEKYPDQWNIKRVIAIGGQNVRTNKYINPSSQKMKEENDKEVVESNWVFKEAVKNVINAYVPPYYIWVEGDNRSNSRDSRYKNHGPVSKKILVGIAEYRVWPPWRMGKID
ncbi:MAG: signal peptidase I [Bacillariaceae sp.]|jgi:signal peptidase I